jgi:hypothetical protein
MVFFKKHSSPWQVPWTLLVSEWEPKDWKWKISISGDQEGLKWLRFHIPVSCYLSQVLHTSVIIFEDNYATYSSTGCLKILRSFHFHFLQVLKRWFNYWVYITDLFIRNCKEYFHTIEADFLSRWNPYFEKVHYFINWEQTLYINVMTK